MKLGFHLPTLHSLELSEQALGLAEQLGFDDLWVGDHLLGAFPREVWEHVPASAGVPDVDAWLDPFCVLAALADRTRLRVGTCVTDATRRRGADLVRTALTLEGICPGGFVLGIGSGEAENLLPFGYDFSRPVGNLERALIEIRSLLDTGEMPQGIGRTGLSRETVPEVWVSAEGPRALRLAGTYGDGWFSLLGDLEHFVSSLEIVREAARRAARPLPTVSATALVIMGPSRAELAARMEATPITKLLALFLPGAVWSTYGLEHPAGADCRGLLEIVPHALDPELLCAIAPQIPFELVEELAQVGNAREVAESIRPFAQAGCEHVVIVDWTGITQTGEGLEEGIVELATLTGLLRNVEGRSSACTPSPV